MITRSRQVALLLFEEVELLDFASVVQVLTLAGRHWNWRPFKLHAVAESPSLIATSNQLRVEANVDLAACPAPEVVILPGGYGAVRATKSERTVTWLSQVLPGAQLCCCVGNGALLVEAAGAFAGEPISVSQGLASQLSAASTRLIPNTVERVIGGQKLLSARSSEGGLELGLLVIERLLGASLRKRVQTELMLAGEASPIDLSVLPGDATGTSQS